ncbi:hypothetical protein [Aquabacterium sp.]|uniref:hypothetical protein n=1 Tax=Aquabacterium sp. TaxID=1872578 RepID=UPI00378461D5
MSETTLRTVTLETVANYRQAAEHTISAYRASGHRLLGLMSRNVERATQRGAERVAPRLAAALRRTSSKVTVAAARGIDAVSARSERALDLGGDGISQGLGRVADIVEGIENRYLAGGLQAAARISLTGARAALGLSRTLLAGADKLSTAAAGPVKVTKRASTPRRAAKTAAKPARAAAKKAPRSRRAAV